MQVLVVGHHLTCCPMGSLYMVLVVYASGIKRWYLYLQVHTNPIPGPQKPLWVRCDESHLGRRAIEANVLCWYEHIISILEYADYNSTYEDLGCGVDAVQHCVTLLPPNEADGIWAHHHHEERHLPPHSEGVCDDIVWGEADLGLLCLHNVMYGDHDLHASYLLQITPLIEVGEEGVASGTMTLKVFHMAIHCCHRKTLGVPFPAVTNGFHLTLFFFVFNRKLTKSTCSRVVGIAEAALKGCPPMENCIYLRQKGWCLVLVPPQKYSPGQRRKKKVIQASFIMDWVFLVPVWYNV